MVKFLFTLAHREVVGEILTAERHTVVGIEMVATR